jgi:hypothetical protein
MGVATPTMGVGTFGATGTAHRLLLFAFRANRPRSSPERDNPDN